MANKLKYLTIQGVSEFPANTLGSGALFMGMTRHNYLWETPYTEPNYFMKWENEAVNSYWFMSSPYAVSVLLFSYLIFVLKLGPYLMNNRKPFSLKYLMMAYNIFQVIYNIWFLYLVFRERRMLSYIVEESCYPQGQTRSKQLRLFAFKLTWIWLLSKVTDLLDTVFFVLRKKQSQITLLHVYHHTHMVAMTWLFLKYIRGEQSLMVGLVNSTVHIVMYSYYFLSALGPEVQRYLWWKKYITRLQLFFLLSSFFLFLLISCKLPPLQMAYNLYAVFQGGVFTGLFLNFYFKSYRVKTKKNESVKQKDLNTSTNCMNIRLRTIG